MLHRLYRAIADRSGRQSVIFILVLAAAVGGAVAIIVALNSQESAPTPAASAAGKISVNTAVTTAPATHTTGSGGHHTKAPKPTHQPPPPFPASVPTSIDIPAINVHSAVIPIGQDADGTLAVPQPGPDLNKAAWYTGSVTPGQDGPSVIEGHIDSIYGPSVFYQLGGLKPGNTIDVTRADHSQTIFTVNAVRAYPSHAAFPTTAVYGADLAHPTLRLITCSNFDASTGHYVGNTVVFAHLTAIRNAPPGQ